MKNLKILLLIFTLFITSGYKFDEKFNLNNEYSTQQPYKVELIDNTTTQSQYQITLKVANDTNFNTLKVGEKILFTMPSDLKLESGGTITAGTKFSATIINKKTTPIGKNVKFIINEIIFDDTKSFIILSKTSKIAPLKTISAERILGKHRTTNGTFNLNTVISDVKTPSKTIKLIPDTTTSVGICILAKINNLNPTLKAGTPIRISFLNNLKPEIMLIK